METAGPYFILYSFESVTAEFNAFLDVYKPLKCMVPPDGKITNLKPEAMRTCRFCLHSFPDVRFTKKAHVIPESLGNKYLVSDFECDTCNERFSKLETDFSAWLGAIKTLAGTKGKKGVPKFIPANETVSAKAVSFLDTPATKISTGKASEGTVKLDKESGEVVFKFKKDGYTPIRAYKSLLKIALSMTGPGERSDYRRAFDFLSGPDEHPVFQVFAKVICHELPTSHTVSKPFGALYEKINPMAKYPLHYFVLHYEHFIYGFPLPLNQVDINNGCYTNNHIGALYAPPLMVWKPEPGSVFLSHTEDFSANEKKSNEEQTVSFNLSADDLKKMTATDPKTGEFKDAELTGDTIASILILSEQVTLKKGQLFGVPD